MRRRRTLVFLSLLLMLIAVSGCVVTWSREDYLTDLSEIASPEIEQGDDVTYSDETVLAPTATVAPGNVALTGVSPDGSAPAGALGELQQQVESVYEQAAPSVVNITSQVIYFDWYNQPVPQEGTGSGFVYDRDGHVVTNYHVVADADSVTVTLADGETYPATVVGEDPSTDLAVVKIDTPLLPEPLALGDSDDLKVGRFVVAIGNPFGLDRTLTLGVVSALGRVIEAPNEAFIGEAIQTDAPINPGNSGGPLLDLRGLVMGVNSQIISSSGSSAGIGFAVSANTVRRVVPQLIASGRYPHPWLGATYFTLTPEYRSILNRAGASITAEEGVLILSTEPDGPAEQGGLQGGRESVIIQRYRFPVDGDIIVAIDDVRVRTEDDLQVYLDTETHVGQDVLVTYIRDGEIESTTVTLGERPAGAY